ncbi:hypothetical protein BD414DRAFT_172194 [Trametes punicea]|nr:hypothetical protein BD414DRAFT_172194 [Trametes punicea]
MDELIGVQASFATSRTSLDHRATYAVVPSQLHVDIDPSRWGDGSFGSDDALVQNVTVDEMMARARSAFSLADHLRDTSSWVHEPSRDAEPLSLEELQMAWSLARSSDLAAPQRIDLLGMAAETEVDLSADQALTQNRGGSASPLVAAQGWGDGEHPFSFIVDGDWVSDMADGRGRYL